MKNMGGHLRCCSSAFLSPPSFNLYLSSCVPLFSLFYIPHLRRTSQAIVQSTCQGHQCQHKYQPATVHGLLLGCYAMFFDKKRGQDFLSCSCVPALRCVALRCVALRVVACLCVACHCVACHCVSLRDAYQFISDEFSVKFQNLVVYKFFNYS